MQQIASEKLHFWQSLQMYLFNYYINSVQSNDSYVLRKETISYYFTSANLYQIYTLDGARICLSTVNYKFQLKQWFYMVLNIELYSLKHLAMPMGFFSDLRLIQQRFSFFLPFYFSS